MKALSLAYKSLENSKNTRAIFWVLFNDMIYLTLDRIMPLYIFDLNLIFLTACDRLTTFYMIHSIYTIPPKMFIYILQLIYIGHKKIAIFLADLFRLFSRLADKLYNVLCIKDKRYIFIVEELYRYCRIYTFTSIYIYHMYGSNDFAYFRKTNVPPKCVKNMFSNFLRRFQKNSARSLFKSAKYRLQAKRVYESS